MKFIKVETLQLDGLIKIISLNRPEVKNAFHPEMIAEITSFFSQVVGEAQTKLIILRGEGTVFSAGADLNWMKSMVKFSLEENLEDSKKLWNMFESIQACPIPVIGLAHGAVFGGALGLLACCDYVYAEENTQFCFSEVKLGLAPAVITGFISRKIQDAFYRPLMISGEVFKTDVSQKVGLAHKSFKEKIEILEVAKTFSSNGIQAMRETKKLLNALLKTPDFEMQKKLCVQVISERRMSVEGQEKIKNFLNKSSLK